MDASGEKVVRRLSDEGVATAFTFFTQRDIADQLAEETGARSHPLDLAAPAALSALFEELTTRGEEPHILVHAAGTLQSSALARLGDDA